MNKYPTIDVEGEEDLTVKELIQSYKDHIMTLKKRISDLENKYERTSLERASIQTTPAEKPVLRNRIRTTSALIEALERRTIHRNVEVNPEDVK